jgi:hypothetical protein
MVKTQQDANWHPVIFFSGFASKASLFLAARVRFE